jgi:hypothetical protein
MTCRLRTRNLVGRDDRIGCESRLRFNFFRVASVAFSWQKNPDQKSRTTIRGLLQERDYKKRGDLQKDYWWEPNRWTHRESPNGRYRTRPSVVT